jgi:hypothetical protein
MTVSARGNRHTTRTIRSDIHGHSDRNIRTLLRHADFVPVVVQFGILSASQLFSKVSLTRISTKRFSHLKEAAWVPLALPVPTITATNAGLSPVAPGANVAQLLLTAEAKDKDCGLNGEQPGSGPVVQALVSWSFH